MCDVNSEYKQGYIDAINNVCNYLRENCGLPLHYSDWEEYFNTQLADLRREMYLKLFKYINLELENTEFDYGHNVSYKDSQDS